MGTAATVGETLSLEEKRALLAQLLREKKTQMAPLSSAQRRFWFLDQLEPGNFAFNIFGGLRLKGPLDVKALERSVEEIVRRHGSLRTTFTAVDGDPRQVIVPRRPVEVPFIDLSGMPRLEAEAELVRLVKQESHKPFDLARDALFRTTIVRLGEDEHGLLLTLHHIISDGWSLSVFHHELTSLYAAFSTGQASPLAPLPIQYADFVRWQAEWLSSEDVAGEIPWWKERLAGAPAALELPTDHPRPVMQSMSGAHADLFIPERLASSLKALSQRESVSLFMTILAAFNVLLNRYTGQEDILVGTPAAGRSQPQTEPLIGLFLNTLILRTQLDGNPTFRELLRRVKTTALGAYAHQDVPFERLVEELHPNRDLSRAPLFQVMFILQVPQRPLHLLGLELSQIGVEVGTSKVDLTLFLQESPLGLKGEFEYNTDLFEAATIERMEGHLLTLLEAIVADPDRRIGDLALVGKAERERVLVEWNDTAAGYSAGCVHELIEAQAERTPDAVAVSFEGRELSYSELNGRANQLASYLRGLGAGPDKLIGLLVERSAEMAVALLGILKSGAAYVPLDPAYPAERIAYMLEDAGAEILVTEEKLTAGVATRAQVVRLDRDWPRIALESAAAVAPVSRPEHLAYVIYTSGSTGRPKGVMIEHRQVVNFLESMQREPGLRREDVLLAVTTLSFDIAGLEMYLPLITGARLEIVSREVAIDGRRLEAELLRSGATVMQATPATWRLLLEAGWRGDGRLKVLCGGEAMPGELAAELAKRAGSVWNVYGPTETTIWSTVKRVEGNPSGTVSIGRPIANTSVYIVDRQGEPAPIGVAGELLIGGAGVARGYWQRAELTAEKFIPNRYTKEGRVYRTGDLARWRADGTLEYLGRMDTQVKVRGYRIELGEIEAALGECAGVRQSVVVTREDQPGNARIVAYLIAEAGAAPEAGELRNQLRRRLPEYMVPSAFVTLERLPLTPNGKVDRKALPAPSFAKSATEAAESVAPRDDLENTLAQIWRDVLGLDSVSITDNFFDVGGHSMLAVRLFTRIEKTTGHNVPLAALFQAPTIRQLAAVIRGEDWKDVWSPVVELNPSTVEAAPPFFCIHSLGANLVSYKKLSALLGDQPFYGLQPHGLNGTEEPYSSIEEMAAAYIRDIRKVQAEGPYRLGGICLGGVVAFEMAQQLKARGEDVCFLLMIDSDYPGRPEHFHVRPYTLFLADWHLGELLRLSLSEKVKYVGGKLGAAVRRMGKVFGAAQEPGSLEKAIERISNAHLKALLNYEPGGYDGKITCFWSSETPSRSYEDVRLAWSGVAQRGFELHVIPGNHRSMIEPPHVTAMAAKLRACLDGVRPARPPQAEDLPHKNQV